MIIWMSIVKVKWSRSVVSDSLRPHGLLCLQCQWYEKSPWDFPGNSTGVDSHFLLQGIFLTQGSNLGLPHCRQMLYCLSHQGSPNTPLAVVGYHSGLPFPSPGDLPNPRIEPRSPTLCADALLSEPPGKSLRLSYCLINPHSAFLVSLSCLWILSVMRLDLLSSINYTMSK